MVQPDSSDSFHFLSIKGKVDRNLKNASDALSNPESSLTHLDHRAVSCLHRETAHLVCALVYFLV